ncbi:ABC transporter ATP-binding protein [Sorangium cellulosum]|uniref:ABC transporter ATP-binding protein n=1 Tax=Sorangium cellulosum So0157-2 TaxID=1254432 RepID=S4XX60_SORCE|nr:ABC transporter ATP-binding protein [Sorangium cellulosum]AGP37802.1 ABC transporter ATP-binding protein [Sorangium cellulosum So0157-2]
MDPRALSSPAARPIRAAAAPRAPGPPAPPPELSAAGITKRFGPLLALDDVSLRVAPGSFHALLGENGAGKSTLVKCIMGYHPADAGEVRVEGAALSIRSPRDARSLGIGMVYQHFTLVMNMTVAENLVLARPSLPLVIDWRKEREAIRAFMARMPFRLDPGAAVRELSAGEKQKLEILKQLYLGSRIILLDEPTSVLTPAEADEVLGTLRGMAEEQRISVLMISHKFREVMAFADEVTVLRRGRVAGRGRVEDLTPAAMAEMMVGAQPPQVSVARGGARGGARGDAPAGDAVLRVEGLAAADDRGRPALDGVTLTVRRGEIVGIAGVSGNGQEELVEVLAGQRAARAGSVLVHGEPYGAGRDETRRHRVRCLPEEPLRNACVPAMSVAENIGFRVFDRPPFTALRFGVSRAALRRSAERLAREYAIKAPSVDAPIGSLSGGNVQRAVLARELGTGSDEGIALLIAANPCFGLDFAAVAEIRARILEARDRGTAVLLVSADLDEIFAMADRILVMSEGRIVHESAVASADVAEIGRAMGGHR